MIPSRRTVQSNQPVVWGWFRSLHDDFVKLSIAKAKADCSYSQKFVLPVKSHKKLNNFVILQIAQMDKEEKEIEAPSKGGKGTGITKKRVSGPVGPTVPVATPHKVPVKAPAPIPALVGSTNTTTTPSVTPPATHTGLPQQVNIMEVLYYMLS